MLIFKKKEKAKVHKKDKKFELKKQIIKKIVEIAKSSAKEEHKLDRLSEEIINFFKGYYGIKYEVTLEELKLALEDKKMSKNTRKNLQDLLTRLSEDVYSGCITKKPEDIIKDLLNTLPKI